MENSKKVKKVSKTSTSKKAKASSNPYAAMLKRDLISKIEALDNAVHQESLRSTSAENLVKNKNATIKKLEAELSGLKSRYSTLESRLDNSETSAKIYSTSAHQAVSFINQSRFKRVVMALSKNGLRTYFRVYG